jgi:hypothetical protein
MPAVIFCYLPRSPIGVLQDSLRVVVTACLRTDKFSDPPAHPNRGQTYSLLLWYRERTPGSSHPLRNATMKNTTPNTAATERAPSTFPCPQDRTGCRFFWCSQNACRPRTEGTKSPSALNQRGHLRPLTFYGAMRVFLLLPLDSARQFQCRNMVFHSPLERHESKGL